MASWHKEENNNVSWKRNIEESSLSRIWQFSKKHDTGTISAFRYQKDCNEGGIIPKKTNLDNSQILKSKLLKLGYGVTKIKGSYIENYGSKDAKDVDEESYFVVDLKDKGNLKKDLIQLGLYFEQDSITYSKPSGEYYLISSNKCPKGYPGFGKVGVEIKLGKPIFGDKGEFFSKINGRPFVFKELVNEDVATIDKYSISEIRSIEYYASQIDESKLVEIN